MLANLNPTVNGCKHSIIQKDITFLISLAYQSNSAFLKIDILEFDACDLRPAQTASEKQEQNGPIPRELRCCAFAFGEHGFGFLTSQSLANRLTGAAQLLDGLDAHEIVVRHLSKVPSRLCYAFHCAKVGIDRDCLNAGFLQVRNEFHHVVIAHEMPVAVLVVRIIEPSGHLIKF